MNDFSLALFTLLIFGAVFALVLAIGLSRSRRPGQEAMARRLSQIGTEEPSRTELNLLRDRYRSHLPWFDRWLIRIPGVERHVDYGRYSESILKLRHHAIWSLAMFAVSAGLMFNVAQDPQLALGLGLGFGSFPFLRLNWLAEKRLSAFEAQLPEALEAITRALRAGYPLMDAVKLVSEEMADPLAAEFKILFEEINAGVDLRNAFMSLRNRVPSVSLMAFTTSVLLQRETGGNLTETLSKISLIIRKRFTFERNVRTLTAEGRMSAWVLGLLPLGLYVMFYIMNPDYASLLITDPQGRKVALIGLGFLACGSLWLRRIIRADL